VKYRWRLQNHSFAPVSRLSALFSRLCTLGGFFLAFEQATAVVLPLNVAVVCA
jgi:hypothetical protein